MTSSLAAVLSAGLFLAVSGCGTDAERLPAEPRSYLHVWTASTDSTQADFLAVFDITEDSARYGALVATLPVPGLGNGPHHTEHEMPVDGRLFANGFATGQTFIFDLSDPVHPAIAAQVGDVEGFTHPHSYLRLPNGNVLATFQMRHDGGEMLPGGLVELTNEGRVVRSSSAHEAGIDNRLRVYSAGVVPAIDRIVTTTTDMHGGDYPSRAIQVWRLSDLSLLHTFELPPGPLGDEADLTAEPRLLSDGRTVLISTFNCGLYLMEGLETDAPSGRLVATFPRKERTYCAIPVIAGNYYLVTVPAWSAVVSLDISDPAVPREAGRVTFGPDDVPHWISISPDHRRVAITGYGAMLNRLVLARFDSSTGALAIDDRFREAGSTMAGFSMSGRTWPHGGDAAGVPHGVVFGRPAAP